MSATDPAHTQASYAVRLESGPTGAAAVGAGVDVAVVVDVLSFTTTLTVALDQGMTIYPYRWSEEGAASYAAERGAVLAVGRCEARQGQGGVSLSPASLASASAQGVRRIVLPSPNGSAISFALAEAGCRVVGASLRNAAAVAAWLPRDAPARSSRVWSPWVGGPTCRRMPGPPWRPTPPSARAWPRSCSAVRVAASWSARGSPRTW